MGQRSAPTTAPPEDFLGVWTWNVQTGIVVACSDVCHYTNIPSEVGIHGVSTERFCAAIHPDDHDELVRRVEKTLQGEDLFVAEYRTVSVEHGTVWVRSSGRCFRDPSGNPTHISGYLRRIDAAKIGKSGDEAVLADVIEHLNDARDAATKLTKPVLSKLIAAVLLEAGFQLADRLRRN